jgi:hypothetical protein
MKFVLKAVGLIVILMIATSLLAQWPDYPTPGVPKLPNGQPDLTAPAPRTADGKPDLSGLWELRGGGGGGGRGGGAAGAAGGPPPATPPPPPPSGPPVATFFNIGANIKEGLPFQPWALELMKKRMADNMKDNPDAHCLPIGLTQLHMHPQPRKIVQTPNLIVIMYESNGGLRQIFMDGRPLPNNDPQPWWYGYSVGKWDGDTLVVETSSFRDLGWLDVNGSPLTDKGKLIERFRRVNFGNMEIDVTVDDPKAYTKPFTVRVNHRIMVNTDLIEFICNENEKSSQHFDK